MTTQRKWTIYNYTLGDEKEICALFEKVFGKPMGASESLRHWQWEYYDNPTTGIFIKLAKDNERIVGHYAVSPVSVCLDGRNMIAALSHDTMTDPSYAGLGIFRHTANAVYADQKNEGHGFVYGFPNRNSIRGFKKNLYWQQIMPMPIYIRPVGVIKNISKRLFTGTQPSAMMNNKENVFCKLSALLSDESSMYKIKIEQEFGEWADELWQRCCHQHRLWMVRNKTYLNWRYISRPENQYVIVSIWSENSAVGYLIMTYVTKEFGATLFVLDFLVDLSFQKAADILIGYIVKLAQKSGAAFASVLLTPGSKYRKLFRRHLFLPLPEMLFPQPLYFGARCFDAALNDVVFDPGSWSLSWGDTDVL